MSRRYWQLDVFAERPLTGNGLAVFDDASALDDAAMQAWTRELRQFESIFLLPGDDPRAFRARIFTLEEELPFAGHPLLGAAALLHHLRGGDNEQHWTLHLASKSVALRSVRAGRGFYAEMDQGHAEFGATPDRRDLPLVRRSLLAIGQRPVRASAAGGEHRPALPAPAGDRRGAGSSPSGQRFARSPG